MEIKTSDYFYYKEGEFFCEEVPLKNIIAECGTPVFVYSKGFFGESYRRFTEAFANLDHRIFYACKSNFNLNVINIFARQGAGVDVNSEGEIIRAEKAGVKHSDMILSGVGKTPEEIRIAVDKDLLVIKAESEEELELINQIAGNLNKKAPVSIRVNPDIQVKTHPYITTGLIENKFGVSAERTLNIFKNADKYPWIRFTGLDMHIGSQITDIHPFVKAVQLLLELNNELKKGGIKISHFDFGGGFGIKYKDENIIELKELADVLIPLLKEFGCRIIFEPGRLLTANGGILLTKVLYTKKGEKKNFLITDAAMTDLIRPSLYGTYHHIQPLNYNPKRKDVIADIVGPVCETGDFLGKGRPVSELKMGEYLSVLSAGAYGMVMSSNYNGRRRPPEVIVSGNKFYVSRGRETFDHLLFDERIIPEI